MNSHASKAATTATHDSGLRSSKQPAEPGGHESLRHRDIRALQASAGNQLVSQLLGGGAPLSSEVLREMEMRFGESFADVRIHNDPTAHASAEHLDANAYTLGNAIVFNAGRYEPRSPSGKRLLAHELAHVVQQRRGGGTLPTSMLEAHADQAAGRVSTGTAANVAGASAPGIQCEHKKRRGGEDTDDEFDPSSEHERREAEKQHTLDEKRARREAGKSPRQIAADEAERELQKMEEHVDAPGGNQRSQKRQERKLKRFERLLDATRGSTLDKNQRKGAFHEAQGTPSGRGAVAQPLFVAGGPKIPGQELSDEQGRKVASHTQPDYSIYRRRQDGSLERVHVNLKAHQIDRMTPNEARSAVREILYQAVKNQVQLPASEKLVIAFGHVPSPEVQDAIKSELFRQRSTPISEPPIAEIRFGTVSHRETDYHPDGGRQPLDVDARDRARRLKREKKEKKKQDRANAGKLASGKASKPARGKTPASAPQTGTPAPQPAPQAASQTGTPAPQPAPQAAPQTGTPALQPAAKSRRRKAPTPAPQPAPQAAPQAAAKPTRRKAPVPTPQAAPQVAPKPTSRKASKPATRTTLGPALQAPPPAPGARAPSKTKSQVTGGIKPVVSGSPSKPGTGTPPSATGLTELQTGRKPIIGLNKTGFGTGASFLSQTDYGNGVTTTRHGAFEGKAWVETTEIPNSQPKRFRVSFHIDLEAQAGIGAQREGRVNSGGSLSASGALKYSISQEMLEESTQRYLAAANSNTNGGWPELRVGELAVHGNLAEARTLLQKLNAQRNSVAGLEAMKEGDEQMISAEGAVAAQLDASSTRGKGGASIQLGYSKSGSVMRHVALRGGKYYITVRKDEASSGSAGLGFGYSGVGMSVSGSRDEHSADELTFVIDAQDPLRSDRFAKILGATSMSQLHDVRGANKDLASWHTREQGKGKGSQTSVSGGPVAPNLLEHGDVTEATTEGPEGIIRVYTGTGTGGGSITAGDKTLISGTRTDQFRGGASANNKGFGETTSTRRETDFGRSLDKFRTSFRQAPGRTLAAVVTGNQPLIQESSHQQGVALTDDSYAALDALARRGPGPWAQAWRGSMSTYEAWCATWQKVLDAGGNRQMIAKALAEFEGEPGQGRHETVKVALGSSAISFEIPEALADQKVLFDNYVVADPVAAAEAAGDNAATLAELNEAMAKLGLLGSKIAQNTGAFERPADYIEMRQRIDVRKRAVREAIARRSGVGKPRLAPAAGGTGQAGKDAPAPDPNAESVAKANEAMQRVTDTADVIARLTSYRQTENAVFAAMEQEFKGSTILGYELPKLSMPDTIKLLAQERLLKEAYPKWDTDLALLRKLLQEAGSDPAKADPFKPNRQRYLELDARVPYRNYGAGLPGYREI